ncbi:hypothetical protein SD235_04860 [Burkholderia cepacia]|uniref:hypothetical protein n=1 Tax=Burkholderia cepacia TaxID=292 RepID=UPI003A4D8842
MTKAIRRRVERLIQKKAAQLAGFHDVLPDLDAQIEFEMQRFIESQVALGFDAVDAQRQLDELAESVRRETNA